jgi:hypothetical protein
MHPMMHMCPACYLGRSFALPGPGAFGASAARDFDARLYGKVSGVARSAGKTELQALVEAALERVAASDKDISQFRGIALYDTQKDETFNTLDAFGPAVEALASDATVVERYGQENAERLALQFVYNVIERLSTPGFDQDAFEETWAGFEQELAKSTWRQVGVANLRHFHADAMHVDLGDGVSVRGRSEEDLRLEGFPDGVWQRLVDDWSGFGASSFVLVAEHRIEKKPETFILTVGDPAVKAQRMSGALRLLGPGDVSISQVWLNRSTKFNVGIGGLHAVGFAVPAPPGGTTFELTPAIAKAAPDVYEALHNLEIKGYGGGPGNLDLALRAFMATYDRWPAAADSQLLDAVTALEAVLGSGTEIAFKLAYRVAGILGADETERAELLTDMKRFYETRSAIVHGAARKSKHLKDLERERIERLRDIVRRLLRGMIRLALNPDEHPYDRNFFQQELDVTLVQEQGRKKLRSAMSL